MLLWIIALAALIILIFIIYYNRFVILENRIDNSLSQIDVQFKKRADLVPNLMESVKGYAKHERGIMTEVTKARKAFMGAKTMQEKITKGAELQHALKSILAIAENYPQLRANENFLHLQKELAAIEDKVAYARQHYNDSILSYNNLTKRFPGMMFAGLYNRKAKKYLEIPQEERAVPKVKF
ncbi:LemA family protein [Candidatus Pacearchaeota archaeon]|nr:LemA family protein [Candidatus Pacearchaeota archaeon]